MKKIVCLIAMLFSLGALSAQELQSPNRQLLMKFALSANGTPTYELSYKDKPVIKTSKLGLELKKDSMSLLNGFTVKSTRVDSLLENWEPVLGEVKSIRNH